jgi:integrase
MASLRKRGKVWYYRYVDSDGVKKEAKGCSDKRATEEMARWAESEAAKIRAGVVDPRDLSFQRHESIPLAQHLKAFESSLLAKGGTRKHALVTFHRAERVLNLTKAKRISDLSLSKAQEALGTLRSEGLGQETINHHVRAVKAFSRWLHRDGRNREHALAYLATANPEADRRRQRRALTPEEAARLIRAAESGPTVKRLDGADRAALYALALGSGFRSEELRTLTPEWFHLDSEPPTVTVLACYAKNGHEAP